MFVKELREALKDAPDDAYVMVYDSEGNSLIPAMALDAGMTTWYSYWEPHNLEDGFVITTGCLQFIDEDDE